MSTKFFIITGVFLSLLGAKTAEAHPVAFKGSYSIMAWNNKDMSDWMLTHSFTSRFSLTARYLRMNTEDGERTFYTPQVNFLLKRWNELESQANVYLSAGHGTEKKISSYENISTLAVEADWESRKYYISLKEDAVLTYKKSDRNIYQTKFRMGFAPYLAEFNEINTWFIFQADRNNVEERVIKLTPFIRFFYKNILTEFGVSSKGNAQFNFMVHF